MQKSHNAQRATRKGAGTGEPCTRKRVSTVRGGAEGKGPRERDLASGLLHSEGRGEQ
jgi:hypothetical protein